MTFNVLTMLFTILMAMYPLSGVVIDMCIVPNTILCSGMLIISGCMFITVSWTQNLPEKYIASLMILVWSIFINHFGFTIRNQTLAVVEYFIGIVTLNILILILIVIYFKRLRFVDSVNATRFRLLVENSSDTMFLYDYRKQEFEYISDTIDELIGISRIQLYELPERFFDKILVNKDEMNIHRIFSHPVNNPGSGILNYYEEDEQKKWIEMHYIPIKDNTGTVSAIEGILRDITDKKKAEGEIRKAEKSKKEFLENISHEIKTPITLIQGYSECLMDDMVPAETSRTYLKLIRSKTGILTTLLNDLTQAVNYSSQKMEFSFYEKDAKSAFEDLMEQAAYHITSSGRKAVVSLDIPEGIVMIADINRIQQVISNLINNAIRYTPYGNDIFITCSVEMLKGAENQDSNIPCGELTCTVSDTGTGIKEEYLPNIFKRNIGEVHEKVNKNSGLGLFIVSQIISQHSGSICAANNESGGAKVTFVLPVYNNRLDCRVNE